MGQTGLAVELVKLPLLGELTDNPKQRASDYPKLLISRLSPYLCLESIQHMTKIQVNLACMLDYSRTNYDAFRPD